MSSYSLSLFEKQLSHQPYACEKSQSTVFFHNIPRLDKSDNFTTIFLSHEDRIDYVHGLLFTGLLMFSFFLTWSLAMLVAKYLGPRRVGLLLSGSPLLKRQSRRICCTLFLIAGVSVIVFSSVFVQMSLTKLHDTVIVAQKTITVRFVERA